MSKSVLLSKLLPYYDNTVTDIEKLVEMAALF